MMKTTANVVENTPHWTHVYQQLCKKPSELKQSVSGTTERCQHELRQ